MIPALDESKSVSVATDSFPRTFIPLAVYTYCESALEANSMVIHAKNLLKLRDLSSSAIVMLSSYRVLVGRCRR